MKSLQINPKSYLNMNLINKDTTNLEQASNKDIANSEPANDPAFISEEKAA
jgi:hypothetical protein